MNSVNKLRDFNPKIQNKPQEEEVTGDKRKFPGRLELRRHINKILDEEIGDYTEDNEMFDYYDEHMDYNDDDIRDNEELIDDTCDQVENDNHLNENNEGPRFLNFNINKNI